MAGMSAARACFEQACSDCEFVEPITEDGTVLRGGDVVLSVRGDARGLLAAERTALNFLQRLSGIATRTRRFVDAVAGLGARIMDTRKTTPNLRFLEKAGGADRRWGQPSRRALRPGPPQGEPLRDGGPPLRGGRAGRGAGCREPGDSGGSVRGGGVGGGGRRRGGRSAGQLSPRPGPRRGGPGHPGPERRVGCRGADRGVGRCYPRQCPAFAECGVDRISVGALTHSVDALDLSMLSETTP